MNRTETNFHELYILEKEHSLEIILFVKIKNNNIVPEIVIQINYIFILIS